MAVTPTGWLNTPGYLLRQMVSRSAKFQELTDTTGDAAAALALTHDTVATVPTNAARPFCLAGCSDIRGIEHIARNTFRYSQTLDWVLELAVHDDNKDDWADAINAFENDVSTIVEEVIAQVGDDNSLGVIESIRVKSNTARAEPKEARQVGDYFQIVFEVDYRS